MQLYRYKIKPLSAFATPMRSDTLYGQMLWAMAELEGEESLKELIKAFEEGSPPFKLSSAVPEGFLPMPVLPPGPMDDRWEGAGERNLAKKFKKLKWLPVEIWSELKGKMSRQRLFEWFVESYAKEEGGLGELQELVCVWDQPHVAIDRRTGNVREEGGLFFTECYGPALRGGREGCWELYVETEDTGLVEKLLGHVATVGFGAKASAGMGRFSFERDESFNPAELQDDDNAQLCLSVMATTTPAEVGGWWRVEAKAGKVWSGFMGIDPFKLPMVLFKEGAVFTQLPERGFVIRDIHPREEKIVQICWPLTLKFNLMEAEA